MDSNKVIREAQALFEKLIILLEEHKGENYISAVRSVIQYLSNNNITEDERIHYAKSIFKTMMGGMGTLGDFVIWDECEENRILLNERLSDILAKIWNILEL